MPAATPVVAPRSSARLCARAATFAGVLMLVTGPGASAVVAPAPSTAPATAASIQAATTALETGSPGTVLLEGVSGARWRLEEGRQGTGVDTETLGLRVAELRQRISRVRQAIAEAKASHTSPGEIMRLQLGLARLEDQVLLAGIQREDVGTR